MWTHFAFDSTEDAPKETVTHRKEGWAAKTGSFCATLSFWSEWKLKSDASASTLFLILWVNNNNNNNKDEIRPGRRSLLPRPPLRTR